MTRRPVIILAMFFLSLSLFSQMLVSTGVAATLGLDTKVAEGDAAEDVQNETKEVDSGAPTGETLFGAWNVLSSQIASVLGILNPGLRMLYNAGVPGFLVGSPSQIGFLPPIVSFIKFIGIVMFIRGL